MAKILIVDDEPEIIFLAKKMLEKEGYSVVSAESSEECFKRLKEERPDLILMDVMMPDDDGWETCRKIKDNEETRDILVATFTVRTSDDSVDRSFKHARADAHINKPFTKKEFITVVENLLKGKKS